MTTHTDTHLIVSHHAHSAPPRPSSDRQRHIGHTRHLSRDLRAVVSHSLVCVSLSTLVHTSHRSRTPRAASPRRVTLSGTAPGMVHASTPLLGSAPCLPPPAPQHIAFSSTPKCDGTREAKRLEAAPSRPSSVRRAAHIFVSSTDGSTFTPSSTCWAAVVDEALVTEHGLVIVVTGSDLTVVDAPAWRRRR